MERLRDEGLLRPFDVRQRLDLEGIGHLSSCLERGKELFLKLGLLYDCDVRQYENIVYVEKLHLVVLACSSIYICF